MTEPTVKLRRDQIEWRHLEDEIVALNLATSMYLSVSATGVELWDDLLAGATPSALAARLAERHGVPVEDARRDVDAFLAQLDEQQLLDRT